MLTCNNNTSRPPQTWESHWRSSGHCQGCYRQARLRTMTGWDGRVREGGGGEYNGECLLDDDCDDNEYNNSNKMIMQRMERGCGGDGRRGESDNGCNVVSGPSVRGVGRRTLNVSPHAATTIDDNNDCCCGRGVSSPPLSDPSIAGIYEPAHISP